MNSLATNKHFYNSNGAKAIPRRKTISRQRPTAAGGGVHLVLQEAHAFLLQHFPLPTGVCAVPKAPADTTGAHTSGKKKTHRHTDRRNGHGSSLKKKTAARGYNRCTWYTVSFNTTVGTLRSDGVPRHTLVCIGGLHLGLSPSYKVPSQPRPASIRAWPTASHI